MALYFAKSFLNELSTRCAQANKLVDRDAASLRVRCTSPGPPHLIHELLLAYAARESVRRVHHTISEIEKKLLVVSAVKMAMFV